MKSAFFRGEERGMGLDGAALQRLRRDSPVIVQNGQAALDLGRQRFGQRRSLFQAEPAGRLRGSPEQDLARGAEDPSARLRRHIAPYRKGRSRRRHGLAALGGRGHVGFAHGFKRGRTVRSQGTAFTGHPAPTNDQTSVKSHAFHPFGNRREPPGRHGDARRPLFSKDRPGSIRNISAGRRGPNETRPGSAVRFLGSVLT